MKNIFDHLLKPTLLAIFALVSSVTFAQSPGSVSTGLTLWLKAGSGTTTSGVNVTGWTDQSTALTSVTVAGSPDLVNASSGYNYNPYINFTLSSATGGDYLKIPTTYLRTFFWTAKLNDLTRASTHLATFDAVTSGQPCNGCPIHGGGGVVAQYHELGYGKGTATGSPAFQAVGCWRKNGTATGIANNTPHSGKYDIVSALGATVVPTNVFMGGQLSNGAFDGRKRDWLGPVGEIIAYSGSVTAVEANKIESYLAVKYGITLGGNGSTTLAYTSPTGTTIWDVNTGYHYDVAGIGKDVVLEGLDQPKSHSINTPSDVVIMANSDFTTPTTLSADGQYLIWGHSNGSLAYSCQNFTHAAPTTTISAQWNRVWRTQKTGTPTGNVIIAIDMALMPGPTGLGTSNNSTVRLLLDDNTAFGDASTGEHTYSPNAGFSTTGGQLFFTVPYADIQNGQGFFTIGDVTIPPTVTIAASSTSICAGTSVTFTPTPTNGGSAPTYQWLVNGSNAGTGSTFSSSTLNNGDQVSVILTSNVNCINPATANSNTVTMTVAPAVVPAVAIAASTTTLCAGSNVSFTATPTNGGISPAYQWMVNGTNSGTGSTFSSSGLNNGDIVTVELTSNATCVSPSTANSNTITMVVTNTVVPAVNSVASSTSICSGTAVNFTATPTNGGTSPTYQWQVNGVNVGIGSTYSSSGLNNNDVVTVLMTSNAPCAIPTGASATPITISVTLTPTAAFSYSPTELTEANPDASFQNQSVNSTSWLWDFGANGSTSTLQNPNFTFPGPGTYTVILEAFNGVCTSTTSVIIIVDINSSYYIPNTFTPNGDLINDFFSIIGEGISADNFEMDIFNRWGGLVYKTTDIKAPWKGNSSSGTEAPSGTYVYMIKFKLNNSLDVIKKAGSVTLFR